MKQTINQTFEQAIKFHKEGKIIEAERLYRLILNAQPEHLSATNNLGIIQELRGKSDEAAASFKKATEIKPNYVEAHNNLGVALGKIKKLNEAELSFKKAIGLRPNFVEAHNNLGNTLQELGRSDDAIVSFRKAIELRPNYVDAYNNLGITLDKMNKLNEAELSFIKATELKPDYAEAYNNLGVTMQKLERSDEAIVSFRKAAELKPNYTEAHYNLGNMMQKLGRSDDSIVSFRKVIELKPNYLEAWFNIYLPLQSIKSQGLSVEDRLPLLDKQVTSKYAQIFKSILNYRLNLGSPSADSSLNEALKILSSADNTFIKNPKISSNELIKPALPKKITALIHFGRSGTGLMHSLIDGHPEVSTLPSIYFSEFFDHFTWEKITIGGWEEMADRFTSIYDVLFDASSSTAIRSKGNQFISNIGRKEGITTVGIKRDEVLSVDKKVFIEKLKQLMDCHDHLDALTFFKLVHSAYEITLQNPEDKKHIFYHIHNPGTYAQLNFLKSAPDTNWLTMVREPVQSCESWVKNSFTNYDYKAISDRIFQMLFEVDNTILQNKYSIGVKLEDLKENPKKTIQALCIWLGIKETESLYQMTAQGKKWWGDPTSPDFTKDGMDPFEKSSINRKLGSVFSKNDQLILRTLFYPFSVRFGYAKENLEQFKKDLQTIRPMLDQMFDFEKKIVQNINMDKEKFMKSGYYLFLHSGMIERWNTLNKFHTYPNMLTLLNINQ